MQCSDANIRLLSWILIIAFLSFPDASLNRLSPVQSHGNYQLFTFDHIKISIANAFTINHISFRHQERAKLISKSFIIVHNKYQF